MTQGLSVVVLFMGSRFLVEHKRDNLLLMCMYVCEV